MNVSTRFRVSIITLLIAAVMVRAFVPSGFMFERGADGGIVLELCGGSEGYLIFDPETGETTAYDPDASGSHDEDAAKDDTCGFALATTFAPPAERTDASAAVNWSCGQILPILDQQALPNLARAPPPARGPPILG